MRKSVCLLATANALAVTAAFGARSREQHVNGSGFAVSGFDVVTHRDKTQSPVGQSRPAPTQGLARITAEHDGATFAFATEANRVRLLAGPAAFSPQHDGHCAFGVAKSDKAPGGPQSWRIVDGNPHLNLQSLVADVPEAEISGHFLASGADWPGIDVEPASARPALQTASGVGPIVT